MRKKMNLADQYYIDNHCETMEPEEISQTIELNYDSLFDYFISAKKNAEKKRKESKNGVTVLTVAESNTADNVTKKKSNDSSIADYVWRS